VEKLNSVRKLSQKHHVRSPFEPRYCVGPDVHTATRLRLQKGSRCLRRYNENGAAPVAAVTKVGVTIRDAAVAGGPV
jgi:hypothetical protein